MRRILSIILLCALLLSGSAFAAGVQPIVEARLPEFAPYPDETTLEDVEGDAWDKWFEERKMRQEAGAGCSEGMEPFCGDLLRAYLSGTSENRVLSPANIWMAYAVLAEATEGETRQEFLDALGCEDVEHLRAKAEQILAGNTIDDGATVQRMAASVWLSEALPYDEGTLRALADVYRASSWAGEMGSEELNAALQQWLNEQTGGLLEGSVDGVRTDPETLLALCTTIYLRARWTEEFYEESTQTMPFHAASGDVDADFLRRNDTGVVWFGDGFSAVALSMDTGGAMWVILPDEGLAPDDLLADDDVLAFLLCPGAGATAQTAMVHLAVPKFDVSAELDLRDGMRDMGITRAFDPNSSDWSAIAPGSSGVYVSQVSHAARVKIDEKGCEAAAYTVAMACGAALPPDEVIEFTADRPFLFVITGADDLTLFAGVVQLP